jgi:hypothetical protein
MFVGAALLAASAGLYAQAPQGDMKGKGERRHFDCSQAQDTKACEERVAKMKAAMEKAKAACEGKQGNERHACMRTQMCAQTKDPKACEARAEKMKAAMTKARQACESKQGDERRDCMRHEVCAQSKDPAKCEAKARERFEKRKSHQ